MTSGRKLLLVGINYAPEETGIAPYTTGLAEHMTERGWDVTVATGMPHYPQWRVERAYRRRFIVPERRRGVDLLRFRTFIPQRQSVPGRALYEATFFLRTGFTRATRVGADCVIGVVPSLGGGAAAAILARRYKARLGLIFQDLVGQAAVQSGLPGGGKAARPARSIERFVARRADGVAIVAESFRSYLEEAGVEPERIVHLPNWAHVAAPTGRASAMRQSLGWPADQRIVLHAGNMGYKQDLANVVEAARLADAQSLPLLFVLMGDGAERSRLEALAADCPRVRFVDPQPRETFMEVLAAADVLVLNERPSVLDMSLPSKITSYFCSGRPVVAAVSDAGSTARELARSGGALVTSAGDPAGLLAAIQTIAGDPSLAERLVQQAKAYAETRYDESALLRRFEHFIEGLVSDRGGPTTPSGSRKAVARTPVGTDADD